ncbi:hypothetical protein CXB51_011554 [Gossypium anomalum]|uniref:Lecithin-cholesterol acyltransferase-like 1 n=1 Tax=Gossypium anomalum TaxID=47600 RepID=A0A8J6D3V8_9ROSI|nr:hypothetical protein CXB51_011554 [Gossypium anomalum]
MRGLGLKLALLRIAMMLCVCKATSTLHPLILVPGSGGNQLEARLTTGYKPSGLFCGRFYPISKDKEGWFRLWFDPSVLLAPFTKCFNQRMMLYYDPDLDDYCNAPGVETRVPEFGSTNSLLYLNPNLKRLTAYMAPLVKFLEEIGYVSGETMFGAPYDFRYGLAAEGHPSHVGSKFLQDLKDLIEQASASNGGKPVILLSHSLGGLYVLQLLNRNPPSWRRRYIKHFIALSAPWGGTVQEILTFASGSSFGVPLVDPLLVRGEQRSSESNLWLMPSPKLFGPGKALVITPNKAYSAHDIPEFLNDIGYPEGVIPYISRILPMTEALPAPNVGLTCIFGTGVNTPETLLYGKAGFDKQPEAVYGDGDGTVNLESLSALESLWAFEKNQSLKVIRLSGISHTSILEVSAALDAIIAEISSINSKAQAEVSFE